MSGGQIKPGYKRTEVGVIPEDWEVKPLGAVISKGRLGGNYSNSGTSTDFPLMKMGNLGRGSFQVDSLQFITPGVFPQKEHQLKFGDVILNTRNTLDLVGKVAIWRNEIPAAYFNSNLIRLEFRTNEIAANEYANAFLNTKESVSRIRELATGTTSVAAIYTRDLIQLPFIVPPVHEQLAIASALSGVNTLLTKLNQLITKKRDLKQAAMQQLLSGQTRLPGFSGEWEVKRLGDIGDCLRGVTYKGDIDLSAHDTVWTKRLLRSNNVQNSTVVTNDLQFVNADRVAEQQILRKQDILICMANGSKALVGKAGFFDIEDGHEYTFGAFMGCFRTKIEASNPAFVFYLFQTSRYKDYINSLLAGSSINNLSPGSIESLEFKVPTMEEQTAIATVLSAVDAELTTLEARREKTLALKQGMMQELLTGRTRLL